MTGEIKLPRNFNRTIVYIAERLEGKQYAIRGTASLVLQGIAMNVDDIDIICDKTTALFCNKLTGESLTEKVEFKRSERFESYFGKFKVFDILVEVMGDWRIKKANGTWTSPFNASNRKQIELEGKKVWVTTIEEELLMFAAMGRWNAYWKIKKSP